MLAAKPRFTPKEVELKRADDVPNLEFPISETLPNREPALAEESPKVRLPDRELENAEFESDPLRADDPPNWRLSKFDIAREGKIAEPLARVEFVAIEPLALDMLLEELDGLANDPRDSSVPLAEIAEPAPGDPKFRATAEPPALAEFVEFPNPCHWPSAIAGRADERTAPLLNPPPVPREPGRALE